MLCHIFDTYYSCSSTTIIFKISFSFFNAIISNLLKGKGTQLTRAEATERLNLLQRSHTHKTNKKKAQENFPTTL
jgi:hypothetical protein